MLSSLTADVVATVIDGIEDRGYDDVVHKATLIKNEANQFFKDQAYDVAIELYTIAIKNHPTAMLYSNRSLAFLKKEFYGAALEDANEAIALDPSYVKAFYRRATAHMGLSQFKKALCDYQAVLKVRPSDADAKKKCVECRNIVRINAFKNAISTDHDKKSISESININTMAIEDNYEGPHLEDNVTVEFMMELIETFKKQKKLHKKYAFKMLLDFFAFVKELPTMVEIKVPDGQKFTICGDVHGQFYDLCNIFTINGYPSEKNPYLFNGDFVDRGAFSVETIFTMVGFKLLYPNHFFMSRGNHESDVMNKMYGFEGEVKHKYTQEMSDFFTEIFCHLPLCHLINDKIFVCHGGLFKEDNVTLDDIRKTGRVRQPPDEGIMCDLLWSDPQPQDGRSPSKRGVGCQFGPDVTHKWCKDNGIEYVVRSHEVKIEGYEEHHDGKCYTVFSAPNYCDQMGNKGAFITITGDNLTPRFTTFDCVPHPDMPPMAYSNTLFGF